MDGKSPSHSCSEEQAVTSVCGDSSAKNAAVEKASSRGIGVTSVVEGVASSSMGADTPGKRSISYAYLDFKQQHRNIVIWNYCYQKLWLHRIENMYVIPLVKSALRLL
jgi:hypothetical protein